MHLEVNGLIIGSHAGLLESLRESLHMKSNLNRTYGVSVASASNILGSRTELHSQTSLGDHLGHMQTAHVHTENLLGLLVSQDLDQTVRAVISTSTAVTLQREHSLGVLHVLSLQLSLGLAHHGNLGLGVHHTGNDIVVDVTVAGLDDLSGHHTLLLSLVGEHRTTDNITDSVDVRLASAEVVIDLHEATLVHVDTNLLQVESLRVGHTTNAHQNSLSLQSLLLSICI